MAKNEVAVQEMKLNGIAQVDQDMLADMEGVEDAGISDRQEDRGTPLLNIAQKGSKQVNKREALYVPGLEVGMAFNNLTNRYFDTENQGMLMVPCFHRVEWLEWTPVDSGGGFHGSYPRDHPIQKQGTVRRDKSGKERSDIIDLPNGHELILTHQYFCLIVETMQPIVVPMSSSNLRASSRLQALIADQKAQTGDGRIVTLPAFFNTYLFKTVYTTNEKGDWYRWSVALNGPTEPMIRKVAKEFALAVKAGDIQVAQQEADMVRDVPPADIIEGQELPI